MNDVVTFLQTCGPSEATHAPGDVPISTLKQVALNRLSDIENKREEAHEAVGCELVEESERRKWGMDWIQTHCMYS